MDLVGPNKNQSTIESLDGSYPREGRVWPSEPEYRGDFRNGPEPDARIQVKAFVIVEKGLSCVKWNELHIK